MIKILDLIREAVEENKPKLYPLSTGGAKTLILLPGSGKGGGQGGSDFTTLKNNLGKEFSIYTADFPNALDVRTYAKQIANEINSNKSIGSFNIGGFSIGGAIAWHLAKELEALGVKKFNRKLFFIDSGIADSSDKFVKDMLSANPSRYAIAQPLSVFKKNRQGANLSDNEEREIKKFYNKSEVEAFKKRNEGNYLAYEGSAYPPSTNDIESESKTKNLKDPWIIEDKYESNPAIFKVRYSVKPIQIKGKSFLEGDKLDNESFAKKDTEMKKGLGREPLQPGEKELGALSGVKTIYLIAGNGPEGAKDKNQTIAGAKAEAQKATTAGGATIEVIDGVTHGGVDGITKSPKLAAAISKYY